MAGVEARSTVQFRNSFGQYRRELDQKAIRTLQDVGAELEREAVQNAPKKTGELARSIGHRVEGKRVTVRATAAHAGPQEKGSRPHTIPGAFGRSRAVQHPGNPATRFLRRATRNIGRRFIASARRHY